MRKTCAVHVQLESLLLVLRLLYRSCANSLISFSSFSIVRLLAYVWQRMENSLPDRGLEESTGQSRGLQLRLRLASAMADGMTGHSLVLPPSASWVKKKQVRQASHSIANWHGSNNLQQGVGHYLLSN